MFQLAEFGRELYTAPFIWISNEDCSITTGNDGRYTTKDTFSVANIRIENKKIVFLSIVNNKTGEIVFEWSNKDYDKTIGKDKLDTIKNLNIDAEKAKEVLQEFGYSKSSEIKVKDFPKVFKKLKELTNEN